MSEYTMGFTVRTGDTSPITAALVPSCGQSEDDPKLDSDGHPLSLITIPPDSGPADMDRALEENGFRRISERYETTKTSDGTHVVAVVSRDEPEQPRRPVLRVIDGEKGAWR